MRCPLIAGNWKMNPNLAQARELAAGIGKGIDELGGAAGKAEIAICPPSVYLLPVADVIRGTRIALGAQNIHYESKGAFTGEISAPMVADVGARYVILGHSERRHTIGHLEDDQMVQRKVKAAIAAGLTPILCVGETLEERDTGQTLDVLTFQLSAALIGNAIDSADKLVVAYEPVWAIGTGRNATPEQAQDAHAHLRRRLRELVGDVCEEIRILYGGSVKPDNAAGLMEQPDVDGGLIGGASLKAESFLGIIKATLATLT